MATPKEVVVMPPQRRDLIVVGASAGGVEALRTFVADVPGTLPAAIAVVLHLPLGGTSALPQILQRFGHLPTVTAASGMLLRPGWVYVAPPDHHLIVVADRFVLSSGPAENGHRPSIDALFRSAAATAGPRVVGVLLSGVLDDGVAGLIAIRAQGGTTVVQDPSDARYPGMPENALRHMTPDHVLPVAAIGAELTKLVRLDALPGRSPPPPNALGDDLERALWLALRSLDEKASLAVKMRNDADERGNDRIAERYGHIAAEATEAAGILRQRLTAVPQPLETEK